MKNLILLALIIFQVSCTLKCKREEPQKTPQEMIENIRKAGTDDLPVSDSVNKMLDRMKGQVQENSTANSKEELSLISKDCKVWQDPNLLKNSEPVFFQKNLDGIPSFIDENKSVMISIAPDLSYYRIYDDSLIAFFGSRGFKHRQLKPGVLEKGLPGILQGLALIAGEIDQWSFGVNKKNKPYTLLMLHKTETDLALKDYTGVVCSSDSCIIIGPGKNEILKVNSPKAVTLQKKGAFAQAKIQAFQKMCKDFTSNEIINDYHEAVNQFSKSCDLKINERINFENVKEYCLELQSHILPLFKKYQ